jgi:hypothetical protein
MMPLSPLEAIQRVNEAVTVEMLVQRAKRCSGCLEVYLDSEVNYHDPKNLGVAITATGREKFMEAKIDDPVAYFKGRTIRVQGVVILKDNRPNIEVDDPKQIEIVR